MRKRIEKLKERIERILIHFVDQKLVFVKKHYLGQKYDLSTQFTEILKSVFMVSPIATLNEITYFLEKNKRGVYLRFGDGDVFLARGKNDVLQISSKTISREMRETFSLKGSDIFKCLAVHSRRFGFEKEMIRGSHLVSDHSATNLLLWAFPYFVGYNLYSPVALHYVATNYPIIANKFLTLLKSKTILFVGNEDIPSKTINLLFGGVRHIKTPSQNAYYMINKIEKEAILYLENHTNWGVIVVAMGCAGRPFMKRIYKRKYNVFLFDFGSLLDGICGNNSRAWLRKSNIDYDILLREL